jgi:hypothetical protein
LLTLRNPFSSGILAGTWANDKVKFIRNPSLKRATDRNENSNRRKVRVFAKGHAGIITNVHPVDSTPGLAEREWESLSLGSIPASISQLSLNPPLEERRLSMEDLSEARDTRVDVSLSDAVAISSSCYGALPCLFQPPNDSVSKENQPTPLPLVLRYNQFKSNPHSAVSTQLWDPAPVTLLKPVAVPLSANTDHAPYNKRETLSHYVPYADLFDYSIYNQPSSHWSGDFTLDWPTCSDRVVEPNDSNVYASPAKDILTEPGCVSPFLPAIPFGTTSTPDATVCRLPSATLDGSTNLPAVSLPVAWVNPAEA